MKKFALIILAFFEIMWKNSSYAQSNLSNFGYTTAGQIEQIWYTRSESNNRPIILVKLSNVTVKDQPSCVSGSMAGFFVIDPFSNDYKYIEKLIEIAKNKGALVEIHGGGQCDIKSDAESVLTFKLY